MCLPLYYIQHTCLSRVFPQKPYHLFFCNNVWYTFFRLFQVSIIMCQSRWNTSPNLSSLVILCMYICMQMPSEGATFWLSVKFQKLSPSSILMLHPPIIYLCMNIVTVWLVIFEGLIFVVWEVKIICGFIFSWHIHSNHLVIQLSNFLCTYKKTQKPTKF